MKPKQVVFYLKIQVSALRKSNLSKCTQEIPESKAIFVKE